MRWSKFLLLNSGCGFDCVWHEPTEHTHLLLGVSQCFWITVLLQVEMQPFCFILLQCTRTPICCTGETDFHGEISSLLSVISSFAHFSYSLIGTCRCFHLFASFFCVELGHHEIALMHDTSCTSTCVRACVCLSVIKKSTRMCVWAQGS